MAVSNDLAMTKRFNIIQLHRILEMVSGLISPFDGISKAIRPRRMDKLCPTQGIAAIESIYINVTAARYRKFHEDFKKAEFFVRTSPSKSLSIAAGTFEKIIRAEYLHIDFAQKEAYLLYLSAEVREAREKWIFFRYASRS